MQTFVSIWTKICEIQNDNMFSLENPSYRTLEAGCHAGIVSSDQYCVKMQRPGTIPRLAPRQRVAKSRDARLARLAPRPTLALTAPQGAAGCRPAGHGRAGGAARFRSKRCVDTCAPKRHWQRAQLGLWSVGGQREQRELRAVSPWRVLTRRGDPTRDPLCPILTSRLTPHCQAVAFRDC